jgi:hypothetical protein
MAESLCSKSQHFVFEHRLVMSLHIGRPVRRGEVVHHINGDKSDNRIENLRLMRAGEHKREHARQQARINFLEGALRDLVTDKRLLEQLGVQP